MNDKLLRIYAKGPGDKRFAPMDLAASRTVTNLFYASLVSPEEAVLILTDLRECNPDYTFDAR